LKARGSRRAGLDVDASNLTGALRLYERAGMHVDRQFDSYQIELRAGKDLVVRSIEQG
jgi:ribosomal protein S18 acetylase RimI-like enzyme